MSASALRQAMRDFLRERLQLTPDECAVRMDGRPTTTMGKRYVAIHPGSWTNSATEDGEWTYTQLVTVTIQTGHIPFNLLGEKAIDEADTGLDVLCHAIAAQLHGDNGYSVVALANAILNERAGNPVNGFVEPLRFQDGGRPTPQGAAWFNAREKKPQVAGVSQTLTFSGAIRCQTIESQL